MGSSHDEWIWGVAGDVDPDAFGLQVFADGVDTAFAADAGSFVTAEGRHVAHGAIGIHPHRACFQALGHRESAANAFRPDAGRESVYRPIGDAYRVIFGVERNNGKHRAEDFFLRDAHVRFHARENRRLDEPAAAAFGPLGGSAAERADRTFFFRDA